MDKPVSDTPITDALISKFIAERAALPSEIGLESIRTYALAQTLDLVDHARRLEHDRGMLMDVLREVNASYQDGYLKGHATIIRQIRTLLARLNQE